MLTPAIHSICRCAVAVAVAPGLVGTLHAQEQGGHSPHGLVRALRTGTPPSIDGHLTDPGWSQAEPATEFTQLEPDEGRPATERTEIRVLYDDRALYIGARMFDREPDRISRRLSSRDSDADADTLQIYLDPMHDHLTGAGFRVSASGVQQDAVVFNDTWEDSSWDAVWESAVSIDEEGWSAELRIPLSQLRFPRVERQTWGINAARFIRRKNETAWLELVRKNEAGRASRMAHLTELDGLEPSRHFEVLPYSAARAEFVAPERTGNPFNDGSRGFAYTGVDLKLGLTSNLTLNGTVNPDFGQVEVDPAVVNLTAFETFFPEKRPFFLEGAQIFNEFGLGGANGSWGFNSSDPTIFYSRRIGRAPQVEAAGTFTDQPAATTILGAAKLTGKTEGGWNIGFVEAVTGEETARTSSGLVNAREVVEPLTNYAVARVQHQIGRRAGAGLLATSVIRRLDVPTLMDSLVDKAHVVGGDGYVFLDRSRDWVLTGKLAGSHVSGTPAVILRAQRAPQRHFQRPDAPHVTLDQRRTSLSGWNGRINLNHNSGAVIPNAALWGVSPGFESNDLGFHGTGDRAGAHGVVVWRDVTPDRFTRFRQVWVAKWWTWNFNRELQGDGWYGVGELTFRNYWGIDGGFNLTRRAQDDRLTRGGPSAALPREIGWSAGMLTDSRQWLSMRANVNSSDVDGGGWRRTVNASVSIKPSAMLTLSTGPEWSKSRTIAQYIKSVDDPTADATYGGRYVFGTIDQSQLTLTTRANLILTPRVSVQLYLQPLLAVGDYIAFKELARPRSFDFRAYGGAGTTLAFDEREHVYTVDPDASGPASAFTFGDPDFNLKSLQANAAFRWELKPGSTVYAVWTRGQRDERYPGHFSLGRDVSAMLSAPGDDVFLVKLAYWFGR